VRVNRLRQDVRSLFGTGSDRGMFKANEFVGVVNEKETRS
jgi:hypothetical protein